MHEIFDTDTTFASLDLKPELLKGITEAGFEHPTHVQAKLIPQAIEGRDILGQSKTGTGKTAAFGIPVLHLLEKQDQFGALVLVPTRELAVQVAREIDVLGQYTGLRTVPVYGGQKITIQAKKLERKPQIIVGTPGRVMDMNQRGLLPYKHLKVAMLDEVDRMLDIGFREDIRRILGSIKQAHQTIFVSATISPEIEKLAKQYMKNAVDLSTVEAKSLTVSQVHQRFMPVQPWDKRGLLKMVIDREKPGLMLVFCRTKATVDKVTEYLGRKNIDARSLHADMPQNKRDRVMEKLREGKVHVLVASDLAARGIDVKGISHVVNYDVPDDPEVYVHRIGRTARAGCDGQAIMFVTPEQGALVDGIMALTNVEIHEDGYDDFKPSPPPEKDRRRQEAQAKAKAEEVESKSRQVNALPDKSAAADASKFPGGIVPTALPRKGMGGRLRTRRS
ncbi:MAG: DEAD/DEAH box helicase [Phycisphaerales bacterium]|nr:DEAD/DEAH box helicase [Phycisphaerales bacterium]